MSPLAKAKVSSKRSSFRFRVRWLFAVAAVLLHSASRFVVLNFLLLLLEANGEERSRSEDADAPNEVSRARAASISFYFAVLPFSSTHTSSECLCFQRVRTCKFGVRNIN